METLFPTSLVSNSSSRFIGQGKSTWTKEENKMFETALAILDENTPGKWFKVAEMIPNKSVYDVKDHYRELVADVSDIEAGLVPIPGYLASSFTLELADRRGFGVCRKRGRTCYQERKKGMPWTEEEHRRFLLGLQKHGKGDWKSISQNFVVSKTPTQVASHAQKYYLRQLSGGKDKRRPSIHDMKVHLIDNSSSDDSKTRLLEKSNEHAYVYKKLANVQRLSVDLINPNNDGALMVFDSDYCSDSLIAYPCNSNNIGAFGSHIESLRFRG